MLASFAPQVTLSSLDRTEGFEEAEANSKTSVDSLGSRSVAHSYWLLATFCVLC